MNRRRFVRLFSAVALASAVCAFGPSASAQSPAKPSVYGLQEARELVMELPEVKAWQDKRREEAAKKEGGGPPAGILTGQRAVKGVKHWAVTLYENPQTEARRWAVFLVRAKDGKIFVETEPGSVQTLEAWRKTRPAV